MVEKTVQKILTEDPFFNSFIMTLTLAKFLIYILTNKKFNDAIGICIV